MTKQELNRYFWLRHEIQRQKKRLERLRNKPTGEVVGDTVKDYRSGKGIPVLITGTPAEELTRPMMIALLEEEIEKNIRESERAVIEVERYIQAIEDPKLRELMRSRFIDCLDWQKVGKENYISPDYARQLIREHFTANKGTANK